MGNAIVTALLVLAVVATISYVLIRMSKEAKEASQVGDLNLKQERELRRLVDDAALTIRSLGASGTIEDSDFLSDRSNLAIERWLHRYDTYTDHQKGINA
jgi:hypothetical protein